MSHYEIRYTDKWTGKESVHLNRNSEYDARGWAEVLASTNDCQASCVRVEDLGNRTHIVTEGHNKQ